MKKTDDDTIEVSRQTTVVTTYNQKQLKEELEVLNSHIAKYQKRKLVVENMLNRFTSGTKED